MSQKTAFFILTAVEAHILQKDEYDCTFIVPQLVRTLFMQRRKTEPD
jgi:hypothetical protein